MIVINYLKPCYGCVYTKEEENDNYRKYKLIIKKMKRFFTLFMAIWALLSMSQAVKATDFYITGSFDTNTAWTKLDGKNMTSLGGEKYSQVYNCTTSGDYRFRFKGSDWKGEMCPTESGYNLTNASCTIKNYTDQSGYENNYFIVNMESGKTYTFTFNSNASNRTVACTVSGSTSRHGPN